MIALEQLTSCFQGIIPSWLCTCSQAGVPNVTMLSHVDYVDARHVALSFQFFNKSKRNIAENPQALVRVYDPDSMQAFALHLRFVRTETEGTLFEGTGLNGQSSLRRVDLATGIVTEEREQLCHPGRLNGAAHINGITDAMLRGQPRLVDLWPKVRAWIGASPGKRAIGSSGRTVVTSPVSVRSNAMPAPSSNTSTRV